MFNLPKASEIKRIIYKKLIYEKFPKELSGKKKERFDRDIGRITVINEISEQSVNISAAEEVSAIFVLRIDLKTKNYNDANIILISKLFGQRLLLALHYEGKYRLAIYESKLLVSEWKSEDKIKLSLTGLNLKSVWENLVLQVTDIKIEEGNTLSEQIEKEDLKEKLSKQIEATENKARREIQAKKKFEFFKQIKAYEKELEEL